MAAAAAGMMNDRFAGLMATAGKRTDCMNTAGAARTGADDKWMTGGKRWLVGRSAPEKKAKQQKEAEYELCARR
jgi:hypothetical protein